MRFSTIKFYDSKMLFGVGQPTVIGRSFLSTTGRSGEKSCSIYLHTQQHTQASNISDLFKSLSKWHISYSAASCFQKSNKIITVFLHSVIVFLHLPPLLFFSLSLPETA